MKDTKKEVMIQRTWLHHFNRVLLEKGVITQREYMQVRNA